MGLVYYCVQRIVSSKIQWVQLITISGNLLCQVKYNVHTCLKYAFVKLSSVDMLWFVSCFALHSPFRVSEFEVSRRRGPFCCIYIAYHYCKTFSFQYLCSIILYSETCLNQPLYKTEFSTTELYK